MEQVTGVEPAYAAWEAADLPVNYTCVLSYDSTARPRMQAKIGVDLGHAV